MIARQHIVQRVIERAQIGIDFLAQIAGQEAQPLARFDRGARQNDALDGAAHQHVDRHGDGEIGLAGAGRTQAEDQLMGAQRAQIGRLIGGAGADAALARADLFRLAPLLMCLQAGAFQRRIDCRIVDFETALQALIKAGDGAARNIRALLRAGDGETVAARDQRDAELALDAVEIAVALAKELRQERIVVELHLQTIAAALLHHATASVKVSTSPAKLFGPIAADPHRQHRALAARRRLGVNPL